MIQFPDYSLHSRMYTFFLGEISSDRHNRYGMGVVGRLFHRRFKRSAQRRAQTLQLEDVTDCRPFLTYWITTGRLGRKDERIASIAFSTFTVQVVVMIISLSTYGFGPLGVGLSRSTGLVLTEWLTLEQVAVREPSNFWVGPSAKDLVHLGAKFSPCMRWDANIMAKIDDDRRAEAEHSGCCVKNDRSGCVTTSRDRCSTFLSTFHKWSETERGMHGLKYLLFQAGFL